MSRRYLLALFLSGLLVALAAASFERAPGYMDADYYYAGALRLVDGWGAVEPYLWNYLNEPAGLITPSFSYWMPLTSLVAAAGLAVVPGSGFWGARIGFLLLAALVPPLTAQIALRLTGRPDYARLAGLLALFPGFYLAYMTTTDAFPIYMVLGGLFVLLASGDGWPVSARWPAAVREPARFVLVGILAALLHLTRVDGLFWLAGGLAAALGWFGADNTPGKKVSHHAFVKRLASGVVPVLIGYGLVMSPWFARNVRAWGSLLPPGGSRALWITSYEETMIYPASLLTPERWLSAGWGTHLQARLEALSANLQTTLAVQGGIILLPFILLAMWRLRGCAAVRLGAAMWLLTAGLMTLVFPYAGINGGFFHAGAALQPLWWALAPLGIESLMNAYARLRRAGNPRGVVRFTAGLLITVSALLSVGLYSQRVIGGEAGGWKWNASADHYRQVEQALTDAGATPCEPVLVNNPPGYWIETRRAAAVIPYGDEQMLMAAARQFGANYVVLERNNAGHLKSLYQRESTSPELEFITDVGDTRLFRVVDAKGEASRAQ